MARFERTVGESRNEADIGEVLSAPPARAAPPRRGAQPNHHREDWRDEQPKAARLVPVIRHVQRFPTVPGVPDEPRKRAEDRERHRHPKLTKAPRLLPDRPGDHTGRDRNDLRGLPERESQDEPEQTDTGVIGSLYKPERRRG